MIGTGADHEMQAAEYVLGLLQGVEAIEAEQRLADDEAFARNVAYWRRRLSELDMTAPDQPTAETLWSGIAAALCLSSISAPETRTARPQPALRRVERRPWHNLALWRGVSAATTLVAAALVVLIIAGRFRHEQPAFVAVLMTDESQPGAVVQAYSDGRMTLVPLAMVPAPQGRTLQVWTRAPSVAAPVAIGTMDGLRMVRLDASLVAPV